MATFAPSAPELSRLVPGFDFLQSLMKSGGAAMPAFGQWVAPTLDPKELQKRIDELRTVQFWLEQNAKLIGTTVQALEVQRMTLATLHSMNVSFADLGQALKAGVPGASAGLGSAAPVPAPAAANAAAAAATPKPKAGPGARGEAKPASPVDPLQWWGALTQQFTEIATKAMRDTLKDGGGADAARSLAGAAMKQGLEAAGDSIERAMALARKAAAPAAAASTPGATAAAATPTPTATIAGAAAAAKKAPMLAKPAKPAGAPAARRRKG